MKKVLGVLGVLVVVGAVAFVAKELIGLSALSEIDLDAE